MRRRSFLGLLAGLPFLPGALKDWAGERAEALEPVRPRPPEGLLAVAMGEPAAVTVVVPPGRLIRIKGNAMMVGTDGPAMLSIVEGTTVLASTMDRAPDHMDMGVEVYLRPTPGAHTYGLSYTGAVVGGVVHPPSILVEDMDVVMDTRPLSIYEGGEDVQ